MLVFYEFKVYNSIGNELIVSKFNAVFKYVFSYLKNYLMLYKVVKYQLMINIYCFSIKK